MSRITRQSPPSDPCPPPSVPPYGGGQVPPHTEIWTDNPELGEFNGDHEIADQILTIQEDDVNLKLHNLFSIIDFFQLRDAVESVASEFEFNQKTVEEIKEEAKDIVWK